MLGAVSQSRIMSDDVKFILILSAVALAFGAVLIWIAATGFS
jgi:hypothetical protein